MISEAYLQEQKKLHARPNGYGGSGHKWAQFVAEVIRHNGFKTVLDYGCGQGTLKKALGLDISEYDPAVAGKDARPNPADLVICSDVLEHIEPEYLGDVMSELKYLTIDMGLLVIALRPSNKNLSDGRNAHLIIESESWWKDLVSQYWTDVKRVHHEEGREVAYIVR